MNNWVYLILIAVLAILAVVMLYSRFAARSRGKSSHHAPATILFSAETISAAPMGGMQSGSVPVEADDSDFLQANARSVEKNSAESSRVEETRSPESDYLDELQEAAAGLALLMRSSPIGRAAPVIFAPEVESGKTETTGDSVPSVESVESVEPVLEETGGPVIESGVLESDGVGEKVYSLKSVIGEKAFEVFERIDLELDALERLVSGIERSLVQLGAPDERDGMESADTGAEVRVSEAA